MSTTISQVFSDIADAIRDKNGTIATYKPTEMATAISNISTSGGGNAAPAPVYQNKTITPTKSQQNIVADSGFDALSQVTVEAIPAQYISTIDADATAADIINTKTAYVNGTKIEGTLVVNRYYTGSSAPTSGLGSNGDIYLQQ